MKEKINKIRNTQKGITLVALVITIIVLLLLAVVSINIMKNSGLIEKVKLAKEEHRASTIQEQKKLFEKEIEISKYEGSTPKTINDLLNKLEEEKLITEEEKNTIMQTGRITIGSKKIIFDTIILPEGYTRCEYLESTGTQYLNLGYYPNNNTKVETNVNILSYNVGGLNYLFGVYDSTRSFAVYYSSNFAGWGVLCGSVDRDTRVVYQKNMKQKVEFDRNNLSINGTSIYTVGSTTTFTSTKTMYLWWGNGTSKLKSISRVYDFKIYENDNIVMNLIPALDSNGTPCMYDTVTGQTFYNQGTGEFIAGPIVE